MKENKTTENKRRSFMGGGPMGGMQGNVGDKPKDFKATMKNLLTYLKPYRVSILIVIILAICSSAFAIVGPKMLGKATTRLFEGLVQKVMGTGAGIDFTYIGKILILLIGLYLISAIFSFVQSFVMAKVAQKISYNMRKAISQKINKLPLKYFDKRTHGEVLSRVTNDVDTVSQTLNQTMAQLISSITTIVGVLIMMLTISGIMTVASLIIIPASMMLILVVVKKSQKYFMQQQEYLGHINGHVEEMYSGHNIMKAFNGEARSVKKFNELNNTLYKSAWKSQFLSGMMMPIMTFIGNIGYVFVAILGGWLTIKNKIEVGDILSFVQYVRSFMQPIGQTAQIANVLQSTAAAAERVFTFLDEEEEKDDATAVSVSPTDIVGNVTFKNVHFGYNPDRIIINDFSTNIKPGQRIAIVGPTGAGKTTIVKLLMRFYELNAGDIYIDQHNIKDLKRSDLRKMLGMVLQDAWLFNGTVMENIRYGKVDATDEEIIEAAKAAHVDHFVHTLPNGYNMVLNEETSNISQGQKQLLTIARAILADPKILILDEATSSVDTRTEVLIQKAMENLMKNRTSFIIAHRLSTIKDADLILVMNNGDIVEQGTHKSLLSDNGFYASLYNSQFETEIEQ